MKRRTALVGSLAALTAATSARAADLPVDLQLVLAVDVSRSIDEVEAELQRRGYIEALTNERVIDAILSGENRRIALCYTEWAGTHYQVVVIDWTVIDSPSAARRFAEKLAEAPRTSQSWTAVGAALAHAGQRFDISAALEFGFDFIDRARDVDRQHELQVDRRVGFGDRCRRHCRQGAYKRRTSLHARLLPKASSITPVQRRQRKTPEENPRRPCRPLLALLQVY